MSLKYSGDSARRVRPQHHGFGAGRARGHGTGRGPVPVDPGIHPLTSEGAGHGGGQRAIELATPPHGAALLEYDRGSHVDSRPSQPERAAGIARKAIPGNQA
jgi:hypothetical protein